MKNATLIADAGSTNCEWRMISGREITVLPKTRGFNPTYEPAENLVTELALFREFAEVAEYVAVVHYYGAGCKAPQAQRKVQAALGEKFPDAEVVVRSDLLGAARAVYDGSPLLCGILGTGSNACYFDGERLEKTTPSLGYLLGDEGSGNHVGRMLLRDYFYKRMPETLRTAFAATYNLELPHVLESIYRGDQPAGYLAQFARFAGEQRDVPYIQSVVRGAIHQFLTTHITAFSDYERLPLGMVGSIAHHFADAIKAEAESLGMPCGTILERPIEALAEYHRKTA